MPRKASAATVAYNPSSLPHGPSLADQLQAMNGRVLAEDEQFEIDVWQKGRLLAQTVNTPGWDVVLEILNGYADKEANTLLRTDPANKEDVLAAHAVAYAASRIFTIFTEDVRTLITSAQHVPAVVKDGLKHSSPVPPESL